MSNEILDQLYLTGALRTAAKADAVRVWLPVHAVTGAVDTHLATARERDTKTTPLNDYWHWRPFNCVEAKLMESESIVVLYALSRGVALHLAEPHAELSPSGAIVRHEKAQLRREGEGAALRFVLTVETAAVEAVSTVFRGIGNVDVVAMNETTMKEAA